VLETWCERKSVIGRKIKAPSRRGGSSAGSKRKERVLGGKKGEKTQAVKEKTASPYIGKIKEGQPPVGGPNVSGQDKEKDGSTEAKEGRRSTKLSR